MANQKVKTNGNGGRSRFCRRADAKVGARKARRAEDRQEVSDEDEGVLVCARCHQPAVVSYGDGTGLFSSECVEERCKEVK